MFHQSIDSYNITKADHTCNQKRGGVCTYFEEQLKLKQIITHYLSECILCEISTENKAGYVDVIYGCASQTASKFDSLMENFEKSLYHI